MNTSLMMTHSATSQVIKKKINVKKTLLKIMRIVISAMS